MQTTLLGLAIAIILALVTALVGPLLIDWGNHRALFETEAGRLIGVNVRVTGGIEPRLLPSPRLILHGIAIGDGPDTIRARTLGVEFALGSLMRGEWRAAEVRLAGPQISLGLDTSGRVRAPGFTVAFKPDELSVDRLSIEDGTVTLTDAASGASVTLDRVRFNGEARSLVGPVKGEGAVTIAGQLYPYRIALGRLSEEGSFKLHLNVDPVDRALSIEADGALALAAREPRFDGVLSLSRPVGIGTRGAGQSAQTLTQPWRVAEGSKRPVGADGERRVPVRFDEQGFKLDGVAAFGLEHSRTSKACCPAVRLISIAPSPTPMPCANRPPPPFASLPNWGRPHFEPHCRSRSASASIRSLSAETASRMCAVISAAVPTAGNSTGLSFAPPVRRKYA